MSKSWLRAIEIIEELKQNLKQASSNLQKLGEIYSELSAGYSEIEKCGREEISKITPQLGDLYKNLKKSVFQMSNTYEQHLNIFKKYFGRNLQDVANLSIAVCQVFST